MNNSWNKNLQPGHQYAEKVQFMDLKEKAWFWSIKLINTGCRVLQQEKLYLIIFFI